MIIRYDYFTVTSGWARAVGLHVHVAARAMTGAADDEHRGRGSA